MPRSHINTSMCTALGVTIFFFGFGVSSLHGDKDLASLAQLGLGSVNPRTIISWTIPSSGNDGLINNILVANIAQPILSLVYFTYNGVFTCMLLGYEWSGYSIKRKGLRISNIPEGAQRSTYFLQLPYRYALPLMGVSGVLHWLLSQSIFLVSIDRFDAFGERVVLSRDYGTRESRGSQDYLTCGYSPIAILAVMIIATFMIVFIFVMGLRRYKGTIPLAGSNSGAISAACHLDEKHAGTDVVTLSLQWGVTSAMDADIRHCSFSPEEVEPPQEGVLYAGLEKKNN